MKEVWGKTCGKGNGLRGEQSKGFKGSCWKSYKTDGHGNISVHYTPERY